MSLQNFGQEIPKVNLANFKKRYDSNQVRIEKRNHEISCKDQTHQLIQKIGGIDKVVNSGDQVLIKANASHSRPVPEGAVVDPQIIYAVIEECFKADAQSVYIGDATGEDDGTKQVFEDLGYRPILKKTGAQLIDFNQPPYMRVEVPFDAGLAHKSYIFSEELKKFDVLISVAKLKTHSEAEITLGMKNLVGMPPVEPYIGASRQLFHKEVDLNRAVSEMGEKEMFRDYLRNNVNIQGEKLPNERLCKVIVDLNIIFPISFTLIDGIIGMEGQGPWKGNAVCSNVLLAGYNPLSTDTVGAMVMGFNPEDIRQLELAGKRNIGVNNPGEIKIGGDEIEGLTTNFTPASSS